MDGTKPQHQSSESASCLVDFLEEAHRLLEWRIDLLLRRMLPPINKEMARFPLSHSRDKEKKGEVCEVDAGPWQTQITWRACLGRRAFVTGSVTHISFLG